MALSQEILAQFNALLVEAETAGELEPTAMTLASADSNGRISARIVLLKSVDQRGFLFVTNIDSLKGRQLAQTPQAALCFLWKKLRDQVQVRVEGSVETASAEESDRYFAARPRGSQIGAWASRQSQPLSARQELKARIEQYESQFADAAVPRPPFWGALRLVPDKVEFWYGAKFRLHERVLYELQNNQWNKSLLYP